MPEDDEIICPDCGKSKGKKGSITQWLGMGEQCHCNLPKSNTETIAKGRRESKCRRCLKPKPTATQSMTQWLFKKDFCTCREKDKEKQEPIRIALPIRNLAGLSPTRSNKLLFGGILAALSLTVVFTSAFVLDLPKEVQSLIMRGARTGSDRTLSFGYDHHNPIGSMAFHPDALSEITDHGYTSLGIKDARISDTELISISKIPRLRAVSLQNCSGFSADGLACLARKENLNYLSLANTHLTQNLLEMLAGAEIENLDLADTGIGDADWDFVNTLPYLQTLNASGMSISNHNKMILTLRGLSGSYGFFTRTKRESEQ